MKMTIKYANFIFITTKESNQDTLTFLTYFRIYVEGMGGQTSVKAGYLQISLPFLCVREPSFLLENGVTRDCARCV